MGPSNSLRAEREVQTTSHAPPSGELSQREHRAPRSPSYGLCPTFQFGLPWWRGPGWQGLRLMSRSGCRRVAEVDWPRSAAPAAVYSYV
jgi:hypothetical protein